MTNEDAINYIYMEIACLLWEVAPRIIVRCTSMTTMSALRLGKLATRQVALPPYLQDFLV
ncbi:hypothetical protein CAter282_2935 [Collimonas arenae]|uniref:Uncharacterized protein n=1 Tax=Collimonas arenae TaxID=279058 RepID=A0A127PSK8_9BURK|nr:hypothetical protein CAter10_3230 [Collimonas arenae]AMP10659.1 hypothetical protein CAter282_2935 [Collimonas arenae]